MSTGPEEETRSLSLAGRGFAVLGAGRLGTSLALALRTLGARLEGYICRTSEGAARAQKWLHTPPTADLDALVETGAGLFALCVPDSALPTVASDLAAALSRRAAVAPLPGCEPDGEPDRGPVVLHTSGAGSVDLLAPCAAVGARTLVFHPLQTFSEPGTGSGRFAGCAVAVTPGDRQDVPPPAAAAGGTGAGSTETADRSEAGLSAAGRGGDPASAQEVGYSLARALGARPFLLADGSRTLYHAAACMASNYLVTLQSYAERLFIEAGMPTDEALSLFMPLVRAAVDNLAEQGAVAALTGPLSRGDAETIAGHLDVLAGQAPAVEAVYRSLGMATLDLVRAAGRIDPESLARLAGLLTSPGPSADPS